MLKITTIGGGSGQPPVIVGLIKLFHDINVEINSVVGTWDNGGSSGKLRDVYGIMPPGDILKNIMAMTPPENRIISEALLRRFDRKYPKLYNHNAGNLLLTILQTQMGIMPAIRTLETLVGSYGKVYPVTERDMNLTAEMSRVKSTTVKSEKEIEERLDSNYRISKLWLEPETDKLPGLEALQDSDVLIVSPGSIFTSIMPHFTIEKIKNACKEIKTKIIIANLVDKNFSSKEYKESIAHWYDIEPTHIIFNSIDILQPEYESYGFKPLRIENDFEENGITFKSRPILKSNNKLLRHDPKRTAAAIMEILSEKHIL